MLVGAMEGQVHRYEVVSDDDAYRVHVRDLDTGLDLAEQVIACRSAAMAFACAETQAAFERWASARLNGEPTIEAFLDFAQVRGRAGQIAAMLGETEALARLPAASRTPFASRRALH